MLVKYGIEVGHGTVWQGAQQGWPAAWLARPQALLDSTTRLSP